jgi:hypothetical protein
MRRRPEELDLPELVDLANALVREFGTTVSEEFAQ